MNWLFDKILLPFFISLSAGIVGAYFFLPGFPIYLSAYYLQITIAFIVLIILLLIIVFFNVYRWLRVRGTAFAKHFQVYKPISKLKPSDFGIYTYYETYIQRESDQEAEKSLKENNFAFITGMPAIGKTRGAYQIAKKLKGWYLLKPPYEKIEVSTIKFPPFFSGKKIVLFLDDLEKYSGKVNLDEFIHNLKVNSKELKVIATCRTGKEFEQAFGEKEMATLLSKCQRNKIEPRKLKPDEEKNLSEGIGRKLEDVVSDGTPGSIVLGLNQMKKRYMELENEPKTILHILKLLREAMIFEWT